MHSNTAKRCSGRRLFKHAKEHNTVSTHVVPTSKSLPYGTAGTAGTRSQTRFTALQPLDASWYRLAAVPHMCRH